MRALAGTAAALLGALLLLELTARVYLFGVAGLHPARVDSVQPLWETGYLRP